MTNERYIEIRNEAKRLEKSKKGYLNYLCSIFNCSKAQAKEIYEKLSNDEPVVIPAPQVKEVPKKPEIGDSTDLINKEGYTYNQRTDKYVVLLKSYGDYFVCPGEQHRAMLAAYSNWGGKEQTVDEIARTYNMRREWVLEYFRIFGYTHSTVPVTDEELQLDEGKQAIERILATKRTQFVQNLEHADWEATQEEAKEWRAFKSGLIDPITRVLDKYNPKPLEPLPVVPSNDSDEYLVIGLSDLHFGAWADDEELFSGEAFDSEVIKRIMVKYLNKIKEEVANRKKGFKEVIVCSLGDILHTLTGFTTKGTPLEADVLREQQFELALNSLTDFFSGLLSIFPRVSVHCVKGNHAGAGDWILFKTISIYFREQKNIVFNLHKSRQACFRVGATAILLDHGASDISKSMIPSNSSGKQVYVQDLFLQYPDMLVGAKSKVMIQGDRHRFYHEECKGFEHVIMSSCVLGDRYADNLGLHSRSRQNCLVLNADGIKENISFYFDTQ